MGGGAIGPASAFASAFGLALASTFGLFLASAIAHPARAAPPDARLALKLSTPRIERLPDGFDFVLVDPPAVLQAELLPNGELLLDPKSPGEARVFLFARRLVRVIEVAVDRALPAPDPAPTGSCEKPRIDQVCHAAWMKRLQRLPASDAPALTFEIDGLQEQAKVSKALLVSAGLGKVEVGFSPYGVRVKGAKDDAQKRRALVTIWPAALGVLRIDE